MQALDVFLSRLMPSVNGCPDPVARQSLVDSAIEFCEATTISRLTLGPLGVTQGVCAYPLVLPAEHRVVLTLKVWFGTRQLSPATATEINAILAYTPSVDGTSQTQGEPTCFYELSPGVIGVYPVPATTEPLMLSAQVATKPTRSATQLDDVLFEDWAEAVIYGALARIYAIPEQFYSSTALAGRATAMFHSCVSRARSEALRGRVRGSLTVKHRAFA